MSERFEGSSERPEQPPLYGKPVEQWHTELTGDDLDVPASRYGRTAGEVAWWAIGGLYAYDQYAGAIDEPDSLAEHLMGYAVNDHPSIADLVKGAQAVIPKQVWTELRHDGEAL